MLNKANQWMDIDTPEAYNFAHNLLYNRKTRSDRFSAKLLIPLSYTVGYELIAVINEDFNPPCDKRIA